MGCELSLWKRNVDNQFIKVESAILLQDRYTHLKQIAHIPMTIQMLIKNIQMGKMTTREARADICKLIQLFREILRGIDTIYNESDAKPQQLILQKSIRLLDFMLVHIQKMAAIKTQFAHYLMEIKNALDHNLSGGAHDQIHDIDQYIEKWQLKQASILCKTRVLIVGPHGPRKGRIDMQYYAQLYHQLCGLPLHEVKNNYVYHIEMLPQQVKDVDIKKDLIERFLMGAELNKTIGKSMLNNRFGMFSDVLKGHGPKVIDTILKCPFSASL